MTHRSALHSTWITRWSWKHCGKDPESRLQLYQRSFQDCTSPRQRHQEMKWKRRWTRASSMPLSKTTPAGLARTTFRSTPVESPRRVPRGDQARVSRSRRYSLGSLEAPGAGRWPGSRCRVRGGAIESGPPGSPGGFAPFPQTCRVRVESQCTQHIWQ